MLDSKIISLVARLLLKISTLAVVVLTAPMAVMCLFCQFVMKHCNQSVHKIVYTLEKYCCNCEPRHFIGCLLEVYYVTWSLNCYVSKLWRGTCLGMLSIVGGYSEIHFAYARGICTVLVHIVLVVFSTCVYGVHEKNIDSQLKCFEGSMR